METLLVEYAALLRKVDGWFDDCIIASPGSIACRKGCSECCRGLFDITLLDAWYLNHGFKQLHPDLQVKVHEKARARLEQLQYLWIGFAAPYVLNYRPETEWEELMPEDDETSCVLLDDSGNCLLYEFRPMTCRLNGIPLIDTSGEIYYEEWCSRNFIDSNPLSLPLLRSGFRELFSRELQLFRRFTRQLLKQELNELDTLIPTSFLFDYDSFDWPSWLARTDIIINPVIEDHP